MEKTMPRTRKLTLTATPEIIALAKEQARNEGTSISAMFSNFIMEKSRMSGYESPRERKIGPITKSLTGIVKLPDDFDEKDFMGQVVVEKNGLK
jgi:hypothetical protein